MSQIQLNRFAVISKVIDGHMTLAEAAVSLGISERQTIRLKQGVIAEGAVFLIHKNTGRKPNHTLDDKLVSDIITLKQSNTYQSANFLHFQELLERQENIKISYSALHSLLTKSDIKSPKKRRRLSLIVDVNVNLRKVSSYKWMQPHLNGSILPKSFPFTVPLMMLLEILSVFI